MKPSKLPESTLWDLLRRLPPKELQRLKRRTRGTRLQWLLERLLRMESYSPESLRRAYKRAFPKANPALLRVYKQQLWGVLQEILPNPDSPIIGREVQIWRHFWMSMSLWHYGLDEAAMIFWQRAMNSAVEAGWYELALWGFSLLEIYLQGSRYWISATTISTWSERLLGLLTHRYHSITLKLSTIEGWNPPTPFTPLSLPPIPETDAWALCMQAYTRLIQASLHKDAEQGLYAVVELLETLLHQVVFSDIYVQIHLATALAALGSFLVHLRQKDLYRQWHQVWNSLWEQKVWLPITRYEELNLYARSLEFSLRILSGEWNYAYDFWQKNYSFLRQFIFHTTQHPALRFRLYLQVYLLLIVKDDPEVPVWASLGNKWLKEHAFSDSNLLWWRWLGWYAAYRRQHIRDLRKLYRQSFSLWKRKFASDKRWEVLLRWMRSVSYGLPRNQSKRLSTLYENRALWSEYETTLPIRALIEALYKRRPLDAISPSPPHELPEEILQRIENVLQSARSLATSRRGS
ncbi:MAG: hypothetical protein N2253_02135 [Bacteroidia bacterium]|nr:hypothetical protein [Bacteroidia bacterium]